MRSIIAAVGMCAAIVSAPAKAADWWSVSVSGAKGDNQISLMDKASIRSVGTLKVRAWRQALSERPRSDGSVMRKVYTEFDCRERTERLLSLTAYRADETVVKSFTYGLGESEVGYVAPETIGEAHLKFACNEETNAWHVGTVDDMNAKRLQLFRFLNEAD